MGTIEILAPAGSPESLVPAVRLGADAVYLGAKQFSARGNAGNFDREALKEAVQYCHIRGVKIYLAINTLMRDEELPGALALAEYAASLPVDALIVQDVGFASLVRSAAPGLRLHGSTQMSVHTPLGAQMLYDAGFARVVLSRELSLREIQEIAASSPIELEVFVHGALCMSVSGQCYFSAALGGRSGNRGLCAQPCRLPFAAPEGTGHDLSLKDCCAVPLLGELQKIGVCSAKIEGRMKRPEYVAAAVSACRLAADGRAVPKKLMDQLEAVFSRSGFTDGYLTGRRGREMFGIRQKENVTAATGEILSQLRASYQEEPARIPLDAMITVGRDRPVSLRIQDDQGNFSAVQGPVPQDAQKVEITQQRCCDQLKKMGGTPYYLRECSAEIEPGLALAASALNGLRREALDDLSSRRARRGCPVFTQENFSEVKTHKAGQVKQRARFPHGNVPDVFRSCDRVYVPLSTPAPQLMALKERGFRLAVEIPRGMFGQESKVLRLLRQAKEAGVSHAWAGTLGAAAAAQQAGMKIHGGFSLNLMNTAALEWAEDQELEDVELSLELSLGQAARLGGNIPRGLMVYGRMPLMLTRNCPAANGPKGCLHCQTPPVLTDRKGMHFPLQCAGGCTEVLNCVPTVLADRKREIRGVDFVVFRFSVENSVESEENYQAFHRGDKPLGGYTRGLSDRGVD